MGNGWSLWRENTQGHGRAGNTGLNQELQVQPHPGDFQQDSYWAQQAREWTRPVHITVLVSSGLKEQFREIKPASKTRQKINHQLTKLELSQQDAKGSFLPGRAPSSSGAGWSHKPRHVSAAAAAAGHKTIKNNFQKRFCFGYSESDPAGI